MKCPFCEADNPSEAVYCKKCGRRLDGMAACQHCGKLTPADGEFCIHCGCNRNAPIEKPVLPIPPAPKAIPEKVVERKETPVSVSAVPTLSSMSPSVPVSEKTRKKEESKADAILRLVSFISCCIVLLSSLVFTFLIGATPKIGSGSASADIPGQTYNLYYFFSQVFETLKGSDQAAYGAIGPVLGLLGVVLAIVGILVATAFAIRAIVRYIKTKEGSITKYAVISYFVFLSGAVLFMLNIATSASLSAGGAGIAMSMALNGATIAGIIIGGIFLLATIVLDAIANGLVGGLKSYLQQGIFSGVLSILGVVLVAFVGRAVLTISSSFTTAGYGILSYSQVLFQKAVLTYPLDADTWNEFVTNFVGSLIFLIIIFAAIVAFLVFFILMVKDALPRFGYGLEGKASMHGIFAGIAAALAGVFELLLGLCFSSYFFGEGTEVSVVTPILFIVFGVLILGGSIAAKILCKTKEIAVSPIESPESK